MKKTETRGRKPNADKGLETKKTYGVYLTATENKAIIKKHGSRTKAILTTIGADIKQLKK